MNENSTHYEKLCKIDDEMRINLVKSSAPVPTIYNTAQTMMTLTLIHKNLGSKL